MNITKEKLKEIIKEELDEMMGAGTINCADLPPSPGGRYDEMTEEQLLSTMCRPSHWKVYYHAQSELRKRGYNGPFPKLLAPNERDY